jgi:hypothetical protein
MALIKSGTITAAGYIEDVNLYNYRGVRSIYTAYVYGDFDSGTVTAYISPDSDTTNDIALKDNVSGSAISLTANGYHNFEAYSDGQTPIPAVLEYTGGGTPALNYRIYNNK